MRWQIEESHRGKRNPKATIVNTSPERKEKAKRGGDL